MDGRTEKREAGDADAAAHPAVVVENEAESKQVREEKCDATAQNDLDTCSVCHLNFHIREPKLLPCLHSFCKKCLPSPSRNLAMAESPNSQVDSASKPLNVIRCPVCRQECMEVDVMENVFVKDSVEAPSSTVERMVQLCMTCDDNTEAAGFCVECVEYLCATCVEAHQRVKFTKDHTIRQKAEASQEVHGTSALKPMFCDIHKQEPLKLFCETCDLLTCRDCQLLKHKDHNYQFLEDAYKSHKQHMESMTHQLQEKKKVIEEVSNLINNGLHQVDLNRTSVLHEIKKSICSLILEINKKGKVLVNQLEAITKDHESVLRKQQDDIGYLSRHLDHVINFTKWATAKNGGTALLYCKRLILFQIGNLLRAKCSASFIPQSIARFQSRSSYWASNVDLGSLVVESVPGQHLGGFQGIPHQLNHHAPSGSPHSFAMGAAHNTLAQLQMQVDKLNPQANWQPQPPPPPWMWYQSVRLQRNIPGPLQREGSPFHSMLPQSSRRFVLPPPNYVSPTSSLPSAGFAPQPLRGMGSSTKPIDVFSTLPLHSSPQSRQIEPTYLNRRNDSAGSTCMLKPNYPQSLPPSFLHRNVQGPQTSLGYAAVSQEETLRTVTWKSPETHRDSGAVKKKRRLSPGPIVVIKDEPDNDSGCVQAIQRASLPDSTGDRPQICSQGVSTPLQSTDDSKINAPNQYQALLEDSNEGLCAVCHTGGELLCCDKCPKVFHLSCHVPTLVKSPSGQWFCSFCRDLFMPEMEYESKPETETVKKEPDFEGGFPSVDKRKCERLLLHLFCCELSSQFQGPVSSSVCANSRLAIKEPMTLSSVKKRVEAEHSPLSYQNPAEFVSDVRLVLDSVILIEADTEVIKAARKLKEMFEENLGIVFPDRTFPDIKLEITPTS